MTEVVTKVLIQEVRKSFEREEGNIGLNKLFIKARDEKLFPIFILGQEMSSGYDSLMIVSPNLVIRRRYSSLGPESPSDQPDYVNEKLNAKEAKELLAEFQKALKLRLGMIETAKTLLEE